MKKELENKHFHSLDGLRGTCAVMIALIHHYYRHFSPDKMPFNNIIWNIIAQNGYLIVELFFILSGFVIAYNYKRKILEDKCTFSIFIYKRIRHIYPVYLISLFLTVVFEVGEIIVNGTTFVFDGFDYYHFFLNLFCIQTGIVENSITFNGPAWCISIELLCYVLWYFIAYKSKENKTFYYVSCFGMIIFGLMILRQGWSLPLICNSTARGYVGFFIGALLMEANEAFSETVKKNIAVVGIGFSVIMILVDIARQGGMMGGIQYCFLLAFGPVILWSAINAKMIRIVFEGPIFLWLGKISLTMYLIHFPIQCGIHLLISMLNIQINYSSFLFYLIYIISVLEISVVLNRIVTKNQHIFWEAADNYLLSEKTDCE